jgi:RNA polymerase sigma-70 factor (ECF subfamily)
MAALTDRLVQAAPELAAGLVDGLTVEEIGALYGVHKTTAFRWVEAARTSLSRRTRSAFQQRVKVRPADLESILQLLQSQIDLSLSRVLA